MKEIMLIFKKVMNFFTMCLLSVYEIKVFNFIKMMPDHSHYKVI